MSIYIGAVGVLVMDTAAVGAGKRHGESITG